MYMLCAHCLRTRTDDAALVVDVEAIIILGVCISLNWRMEVAAKCYNNTYHSIIYRSHAMGILGIVQYSLILK